MIALVTDDTKLQVADAIAKAGGVVLPVGVGVAGSDIVTSDDQMEQFVVVDEDDAVIGYRSRGECHADPTIIHRGVDLLLFDSKGRVLLQKRSVTKDTRPGYWASSVGGHVMREETYDSAVKRETKEELGVELEAIFHSKFLYRYPNETEYNALYTAKYDGEVHADANEVEAVQFFTKEELRRSLTKQQFKLTELTRESLTRVGFL
jgi:isopentenyl-diphosphate delta-isomerase type 1